MVSTPPGNSGGTTASAKSRRSKTRPSGSTPARLCLRMPCMTGHRRRMPWICSTWQASMPMPCPRWIWFTFCAALRTER